MENQAYEQVKALVEQWDDDWGCGPFEDSLPGEDELQRLNRLTGRDWTAEDVREVCFEYGSHNSTAETVYFLFQGDYPPVTNTDLAFYRLKPGAAPEPKTVYKTYRSGGRMKALEPLPMEKITEALRAMSGFQEHQWRDFDSDTLRMDCLDQPDPWSDIHFWAFWYGGRKNPQPDHLLRLSCHNLTEAQIQSLLNLLAGFGVPLQVRQEDHAY